MGELELLSEHSNPTNLAVEHNFEIIPFLSLAALPNKFNVMTGTIYSPSIHLTM